MRFVAPQFALAVACTRFPVPVGGRTWARSRRANLALVQSPPAGKPTDEWTGELDTLDPQEESEWTLDTLTAATQQRGIQVARCHVRRIFVQERVRAYQQTPAYGKALRKRKV